VTISNLLHGSSAEREQNSHEDSGMDEADVAALTNFTARTSTAAQRLQFIRRMRGFKTISEVANYFGWARSTYSGHEHGKSGITADAAEIYGAAFGVSHYWLQRNSLPSGLGEAADRVIKAKLIDDADVEAALNLITVDTTWQPDRLKLAVVQKRLESRHEERGAELERISATCNLVWERSAWQFQEQRTKKYSTQPLGQRPWAFPHGFAEEVLHANVDSLVLLPINAELNAIGLSLGDRAIIDGSKQDLSHKGIFAVLTETNDIRFLHVMSDRRSFVESDQIVPPGENASLRVLGKLVGSIGRIRRSG
jgi:hypothetical protein